MARKIKCGLLAVLVILAASLITGCIDKEAASIQNRQKRIVTKECRDINEKNKIRFEHIAINVEDPVGMAKWYCQNLGMKIVRKGPAPVNAHFISDAGGNMIMEIYNNPPDAVPDYASMDPLLLHIAFMVDDVKGIREKLIAAGAQAVGDITVTPAGDELAMLRDPWGVAIQFVKRAEPMISDK